MALRMHSDQECYQGDVAEREFNFFDYDYNVAQVERNDIDHRWTYLRCPDDPRYAHRDAIIISVDGACRDNGYRNARAGGGVFFGVNNNEWNRNTRFGNNINTNQRAELKAAIMAIDQATRIRNCNLEVSGLDRPRVPAGPLRKLHNVIIKSDSAYVVKGMTEWIHDWKANDYTNSRGARVINSDLFRALDAAIDRLNDLGVQVQFWHVPRGQNVLADVLANGALDGLNAAETLDRYFDG